MATNLSRIQGYVPKHILAKLQEYKQSHDLKSLSEVVGVILEEYFRRETESTSNSGSLTGESELAKRIQIVEEQLAANRSELAKQMQIVEEQLAAIRETLAPHTTQHSGSHTELPGELLDKTQDNEVTDELKSGLLNETQDVGLERETTSELHSEPGGGTEERLEKKEYTAKELASIVGVTDRAVTAAAEKGQDYFREWTEKYRKGIWDYKVLEDSGKVNKFRRYFRIRNNCKAPSSQET